MTIAEVTRADFEALKWLTVKTAAMMLASQPRPVDSAEILKSEANEHWTQIVNIALEQSSTPEMALLFMAISHGVTDIMNEVVEMVVEQTSTGIDHAAASAG